MTALDLFALQVVLIPLVFFFREYFGWQTSYLTVTVTGNYVDFDEEDTRELIAFGEYWFGKSVTSYSTVATAAQTEALK